MKKSIKRVAPKNIRISIPNSWSNPFLPISEEQLMSRIGKRKLSLDDEFVIYAAYHN